jgi:hypothetical protein
MPGEAPALRAGASAVENTSESPISSKMSARSTGRFCQSGIRCRISWMSEQDERRQYLDDVAKNVRIGEPVLLQQPGKRSLSSAI